MTTAARILIITSIVFLAISFTGFEISVATNAGTWQKVAIGAVSAFRLALFIAAPILWASSKEKGLAVSGFSVAVFCVVAWYGSNLAGLDANQKILYHALNVFVLFGEASLALLMSRNSKLDEAQAKVREWEAAFDKLTVEADGYIVRIAELEERITQLKSVRTELETMETEHNKLFKRLEYLEKFTPVIDAVGEPQRWGNNQFWTINKAGKVYRCKKDGTPYLNGEKVKA